jgi:hypothetical protein
LSNAGTQHDASNAGTQHDASNAGTQHDAVINQTDVTRQDVEKDENEGFFGPEMNDEDLSKVVYEPIPL